MNALAFAYKLWTSYEALSRVTPETKKPAPEGPCRERRVRRRSDLHLRDVTREPEAQDIDAAPPDSRRDATEGQGRRG
jgi:hypothetical protein